MSPLSPMSPMSSLSIVAHNREILTSGVCLVFLCVGIPLVCMGRGRRTILLLLTRRVCRKIRTGGMWMRGRGRKNEEEERCYSSAAYDSDDEDAPPPLADSKKEV